MCIVVLALSGRDNVGLVYEEDLVKAELAYLACAAGIALDPTTAGMFGVGDWRSAWLRRLNSVRKHFDKLWLVISVRTQGKLITRVRHTSAMHHSLYDIHSCSCQGWLHLRADFDTA